MKEKNLLDDIENKSLSELTKIADIVVKKLESKENLEDSIEEYNKLIKLNKIIEKKFQKSSKIISIKTKEKITDILKKNGKET
tara:strand:+ start:248 stop:496 length:249 start_codon:yes stop_codon:yes gene_type:complete